MILLFLACSENDLATVDESTDTSSTGWEEEGDTDTDTDSDADSDTDSDTDTDTDSDTDTEPQVEAQSLCQLELAGTKPAYPVFPSWDGRGYVNLTVTLSGATREWATVSWGSESSTEGWWIGCADIIDGSSAVIRVEAQGLYEASTFSNVSPGGKATPDANGFYWYPWSVTGGDLGGTTYVVQVDGETVSLVAEESSE